MLMSVGNSETKSAKQELPTIKIENLEFTLPPALYAVPGIDTLLFLDDIILTQTPEKYELSVKPNIGKIKNGCWIFSPKRAVKNTRIIEFSIKGPKANLKKQITLKIAPKNAGVGKNLRLLIIGDSLTAASVYPKKLAELLDKFENPKWVMFGTQKKGEKIAHEGYGGWTWNAFISKVVPHSVHFTKKGTSPFIFENSSGNLELDVNRYFKKVCGGKKPNVIIIMLGINDCFRFQQFLPNREDVENRINATLKASEKLIKALREAAPGAIIGICLTTPPNSREDAFFANYKGTYHRWTWKQVQHILVKAEIKHFNNRAKENIFLIPTNLGIDPVKGYPATNGVHPNTIGYSQIANSIYCWIKWQFSRRKSL